MANYLRAQSKNNNRTATLVVVLLLVVMGIAGVLFVLLLPGAAPVSGSPAQEGPLPGLELEREEAFPEDEFHYLLNASPAFNKKGEKGSVYLENCDGNRADMQVVYTLEESGEEVYKSPLLPPGWSVQTDKLSQQLEPGEYEAIATVYVYPSANAEEYIALFEETIHIVVG